MEGGMDGWTEDGVEGGTEGWTDGGRGEKSKPSTKNEDGNKLESPGICCENHGTKAKKKARNETTGERKIKTIIIENEDGPKSESPKSVQN